MRKDVMECNKYINLVLTLIDSYDFDNNNFNIEDYYVSDLFKEFGKCKNVYYSINEESNKGFISFIYSPINKCDIGLDSIKTC